MSNRNDKVFDRSDIETVQVIRDAFMQGRDLEAIELLDLLRRPFEPKYHNTLISVGQPGVQPGQPFTAICRPQRPFHASRFVVCRNASDFNIYDLKTGNRSNFVASSEVEAELFGGPDFDEEIFKSSQEPDGSLRIVLERPVVGRLGVAIDMGWCQVSQDLVVQGHNVTSIGPRDFRGYFLGYYRDGVP